VPADTALGALDMSTVTPSASHLPPELPEIYRMTVDEYERLAESGVLDDPRVELINGLLVKKMTQKPPLMLAAASRFIGSSI